ncbi:MAG: hypothetical protein FJ125_17985 [Deltaproteobacteria bacterium]|nr:hypothetical protein [Deltaproteobacteria bacterium]
MKDLGTCATLAASGLLVAGCADLPVWGNFFAMAMSLLIFLGTIGISRIGPSGGSGSPPPAPPT